MIILKYQKLNPAALCGHVDTLRTLTAILRRAKISVEYAKGFNPHMEIFMSQPLGVGCQSLCEYVSVKTDYDSQILTKLNAASPEGLKFVAVFADLAVNLAAIVDSCDFEISCCGIANYLPEITSKDFTVTTEKNGQTTVKEVSDKIFASKVLSPDKIVLRLACGNSNLRPDRVVAEILTRHCLDLDYEITKIEAYIGDVAVDSYLSTQ